MYNLLYFQLIGSLLTEERNSPPSSPSTYSSPSPPPPQKNFPPRVTCPFCQKTYQRKCINNHIDSVHPLVEPDEDKEKLAFREVLNINALIEYHV